MFYKYGAKLHLLMEKPSKVKNIFGRNKNKTSFIREDCFPLSQLLRREYGEMLALFIPPCCKYLFLPSGKMTFLSIH
jgi:hypothetical protein